jgi:hypothetical protein
MCAARQAVGTHRRPIVIRWPEPAIVYPESVFEGHIIELVESVYGQAGLVFSVFRHFGLDLTVFVDVGSHTAVRMVEVKAYNGQREGGVGFGNGRGEGAQVDVLSRDDATMRLLDRSVRWALADATRPQGSERFAWFDCTAASRAAMGGVSRGKQNNLGVSSLRTKMRTWPEFCQELRAFLVEATS